ncbi:MAG: sulfatase-like hydrolase/transferase [Kiritimatiellales bacterium]
MALCATSALSSSLPNVVVILTDDQGYQDLGCFGSPLIKTPSLDQMAAEGCRFTSFYAAASICSPSRAALLTGRYPDRIGIQGVYFPNRDDGMPLKEITLAEILKQRGYATACIGKWHLGHLPEYLPTSRGFDLYYGIPYSNDMWLDPTHIPPAENIVLTRGKTLENYVGVDRNEKAQSVHQVPLMRNTKCVEWPADQSTLTKRYAEESVKFIRENRDRPFFLYLATAMPHVPLFVSEAFKGKSPRGLYGDCVEEIDWAVGQVLQALNEESLDRNTLVVFTSDNGPWLTKGKLGGSAKPLRSGKGSTYEGGQRVPCVMRWPAVIPSGTVCDEAVSTLDIFPTVAAVTGADLPADRTIDGHNILPLLRQDPGAKSPWDVFYYELTGLRSGSWKYREGLLFHRYKQKDNPHVIQLFNLEQDIGEENDLSEQYPEKVKEFHRMLEEFRKTVTQNQLSKENQISQKE